MIKILVLPLDERPCNVIYPKQIFHHHNIELVLPASSILGNKKTPANVKNLQNYLLKHIEDVDGIVFSIDMLLYGGLVPSRLHKIDKEILEQRINFIGELKKRNPLIPFYAFDLIMRCPQYNSNDEEPDYYQYYGKDIFKLGYYTHKEQLNILTKEEKVIKDAILIPVEVLDDYMSRRKINNQLNMQTIEKLKEGWIDFLIIPQDDAAEYGYTALDQLKVKNIIKQYELEDRAVIYPGADETINTLISRMVMKLLNKTHRIYVHYIANNTPNTIPLLEDKSLDYTINEHIRCSGAKRVYSENQADSLLCVNGPAFKMMNSSSHIERNYEEEQHRNLDAFIEYIIQKVEQGQHIAVADVFNLNGSDHELMSRLNKNHLFDKLISYGGWNTSSNTLGTVIPMMNASSLFDQKLLKDFLMLRYVEDYGYMTYVKNIVNQKLSSLHMNYFDVSKDLNIVEDMVKEELNLFITKYLSTIKDQIIIHRVWMPWKRMFEVGIELEYKKEC